MNIITSLIRKETMHILRDKRTLLVVLVMPLVLLILFGYAIATEVNNVNVAAVIGNHDDLTRDAVEKLSHNSYISFKGLIAHSEIDHTLRSGKADVVAVIKSDGGALQTQVVADAANTIIAKAAASYIIGIISPTSSESAVIIHTLYNPQLKSSYNFVPGILGMIFILICAIMTSVSIVSEKESGTMNLLLVSPVRPGIVIFGKLVPYFMLSCLLLAMMLGISYGLLDLPATGNIMRIIFISLIYIVMALSVGLLISTMVKTQLAALIVSAIMFMVPVIMLSGMIFPIDNMPEVLQWLSCAIPARWYISAMRKLMIQGLSLHAIMTELIILTSMTIGFLALAIRKFYLSTK